MHYDSRYYDPDLGRFLQPDSLDVPNKYAYVSNDPVNYTDPSGHIEVPTADQYYDSNYLFYENSYVFSGINPLNTDTYSTMFSDPLTIDNSFIVGATVEPGDDSYLGTKNYRAKNQFSSFRRFLDAIQVVLAGAGMTEPFGFFFDCADACVSLVRGNADIFTAAALVPGAGEAAGAGKIMKLIKMPDGVRVSPDTMVEWIKNTEGKPSLWSGGNNYAFPGTVHGLTQQRTLDLHNQFGIKDSKMFTTAQEFVDEMIKHDKGWSWLSDTDAARLKKEVQTWHQLLK